MKKKARILNATEATSIILDQGIESLTPSIETFLREMEIQEERRSPTSLRGKSQLERLIKKMEIDHSLYLPSITEKCQRQIGDVPSRKSRMEK